MKTFRYSVFKGAEMTLAQWQAVSRLFSSEYGVYSRSSPVRAGLRVRLGTGYYRRNYACGDCRVALCFDGENLIGHAIYFDLATSRGKVALVVQLVVAESFRRRGIASTLLHAIWGFSDYSAWGIVSSNPFTVEALEAATFRKADASVIAAHSEWLVREVAASVDFLKGARLTLDGKNSRAYTGFHVDHGGQDGSSVGDRLGRLEEGEEWLAVVFREQALGDFAAFRNMVEASSEFVFDAYARMPQTSEPWAKKTENLREGGTAVVSVSNYAHLDRTKIAKIDFDNPEASMAAVFKLPPSRTMETSGEFFDPDCLLVDEKRRLVCHKEQFTAGRGTLPGEYLIRDRRYFKTEIESLMKDNGLEIVRTAFVRAGFAEELPEKDGKEILVVSRRILKGGGK